ncbi:MAG: LysM peptidoglycan-binding domain-containing protein [Verrucomicrobiales bacterium]|jgi:LysM repeat protein|nr:LysM peptidoglycan-binding domain-containing protein [Verrucomicrobiales bacterium]
MIKQLIGLGVVTVLVIGCAGRDRVEDNSMPTPASGGTAAYGEPNTALPDKPVIQPASVNSGENYTVVSGDSLWKIARNHGTTVEQLKAVNNLTSELIHPGQVLVIP